MGGSRDLNSGQINDLNVKNGIEISKFTFNIQTLIHFFPLEKRYRKSTHSMLKCVTVYGIYICGYIYVSIWYF